MIWLLALAVFAVVSAGLYLALSRHVLRSVVGISLVSAAANLVVFAAARPAGPLPPVILEGQSALGQATSPLPQALVLTAVVIGFALTCFSLIVALALQQRTGTVDTNELRAAEPLDDPRGGPALEEEPS
jgi:multicomponent Na+:H+ antiporter subunit C